MRPTVADKMAVVGIGATLILQASCLVRLWDHVLDSSPQTSLLGMAAMLLAVAVTIGIPGRLARGTQRFWALVGRQDLPTAQLQAARPLLSRLSEGRAMLRLLAVAAVGAGVCGWASYLAARSLSPGRWAAWTPGAWPAVKFGVQFVVALPMALGVSTTFLVSAMIRVAPSADLFSTVCRDWLQAAAGALMALAVASWVGVHLVALGLVLPFLLAALGIVLWQRRSVSHRARRLVRPIAAAPQRAARVGIVGFYAVLAALWVLQARLLTDGVAAVPEARFAWLAGTLMLLVLSLRRVDRRPRVPGSTTALAALAGLAAGLMVQFALGVVCFRLWGRTPMVAAVLGLLAIGAQVPMMGMASVVISRQRRGFAVAGGRARAYVASAAGGLCLGVLGCTLTAELGIGLEMLAGGCMVMLCGALLTGVMRAQPAARKQWRWAGSAVALACALSTVVFFAVSAVARTVVAGPWLTVVARQPAPPALLPHMTRRRSPTVSRALDRTLVAVAARGRWWVGVSPPLDLPPTLPSGAVGVYTPLDPAASPRRARPWGASFLHEAAIGAERFDGLLLAPLRADHPDAWRCVGRSVLQRCRRKLSPSAPMLLRTQCARRRPGYLLATAEAFRRANGSGWGLLSFAGQDLDVLLIGPQDAVGPPDAEEGLFVLDLAKLRQRWPRSGEMRILKPPGLSARQPDALEFEHWLRGSR
jgi:hypothetical protein